MFIPNCWETQSVLLAQLVPFLPDTFLRKLSTSYYSQSPRLQAPSLDFSYDCYRREQNQERKIRNWNIKEQLIKTNMVRMESYEKVICLSSNRNFIVGFKKLKTLIQRPYQNLKQEKCLRATWKIIIRQHYRIKSMYSPQSGVNHRISDMKCIWLLKG